MLRDNFAEYDRNQTRGVPRPGKALLHGLVYCGQCGHKVVVQYKGGTHYLCNYLRQQFGDPVCQYLRADPLDERVVHAFFAALASLKREHQKALLRCLIDKVVAHRGPRDRLQVRLVRKGGEVSTLESPIPVGSLAEYWRADDMTQRLMTLLAEGNSDAAIADQLSVEGFPSPMRPRVLASTVRTIRLRHGHFREQHQSHPRRIPGHLTVPQIAQALGVTRHWLYDRIHNGALDIGRDPSTGLYLVSDLPEILE
jgi:hypothetical protein